MKKMLYFLPVIVYTYRIMFLVMDINELY